MTIRTKYAARVRGFWLCRGQSRPWNQDKDRARHFRTKEEAEAIARASLKATPGVCLPEVEIIELQRRTVWAEVGKA